MIFYFSATGNSRYVAERLSQATGEQAVSMAACLNGGTMAFTVGEGERIGFVTPTYFWGLPTVVIDFLDRMALNASGSHYVYHVLTFGTTTGQAHRMMEKRLQARGLSVDGKFIVRMVDSWTPLFDLSDQARNAKITAEAEPSIAKAAELVIGRRQGDFDDKKIPRVFSAAFYLIYRKGRKTAKFTVTPSCTGCGICAAKCPTKTIAIREGRPVWTRERCALCLSCLHHCPAFAIRYGSATANHGQFINENAVNPAAGRGRGSIEGHDEFHRDLHRLGAGSYPQGKPRHRHLPR